jgi:hypothetical protein
VTTADRPRTYRPLISPRTTVCVLTVLGQNALRGEKSSLILKAVGACTRSSTATS